LNFSSEKEIPHFPLEKGRADRTGGWPGSHSNSKRILHAAHQRISSANHRRLCFAPSCRGKLLPAGFGSIANEQRRGIYQSVSQLLLSRHVGQVRSGIAVVPLAVLSSKSTYPNNVFFEQ
jgi:hypothetical protein